MCILKLSLIPLGAVTTEQIRQANAEKVTYGDGSLVYARADSYKETKKERKKKKKHDSLQ